MEWRLEVHVQVAFGLFMIYYGGHWFYVLKFSFLGLNTMNFVLRM